MTDQITTTGPARGSTAARRTRRQLLVGGTGALAAVLTAEALARPGRHPGTRYARRRLPRTARSTTAGRHLIHG